MDRSEIADWLNSKLDTDAPSKFDAVLGFTTDVNDMSGVLTMQDLSVFLCHNVRKHVMYYEQDEEGNKRYECLECPSR